MDSCTKLMNKIDKHLDAAIRTAVSSAGTQGLSKDELLRLFDGTGLANAHIMWAVFMLSELHADFLKQTYHPGRAEHVFVKKGINIKAVRTYRPASHYMKKSLVRSNK